MNKKLLLIGLIIAYGNSYAYKGTPNNPLFSLEMIKSTEESKAYKGLAKTLDEINKRNGKETNYISLVENDDFDDFKFATVAHLNDFNDSKRIFLGKRNSIESIEIMSTEEFDQKKEDKFEYKLDGIYSTVADEVSKNSSVTAYVKDALNPLKITSKTNFTDSEEAKGDYENHIVGKSKKEVLEFCKERLKGVYPNENIILENDKLYVVDDKNQKWPIELDYSPMTKASPIGVEESEADREYEDSIYTPIFKYTDAKADKHNGRVFYNLEKDIRVEKQGDVSYDNYLEFSGVGKITKVLSMPKEGQKNIVNTVSSNLGTTKYGHNIIFGSDLELKNVHIVTVSKDSTGGSGGQNIIASGPTTLSFELDGTKKNEKGHYYKHVLYNTKNKEEIVFTQYGKSLNYSTDESLNDFNIRLMVSSVGESGTVDMGRKLNYIYKGSYYDKKLKIPFISDSFVHALTQRTEDMNSEENSLLDVKIRDSIKAFSKEENEAYKSIADSGKLGMLKETTSSVIKNIDFKHIDDRKSLERDLTFVKALQTKSVEEILALSDENLTKEEKEYLEKEIKDLQSYNQELVELKEKEVQERKGARERLEAAFHLEKEKVAKFEDEIQREKLEKFYQLPEYTSANFKANELKYDKANEEELRKLSKWDDVPASMTIGNSVQQYMSSVLSKLDPILQNHADLYVAQKIKEIKEEYEENVDNFTGNSWKKGTVGPLLQMIDNATAIASLVASADGLEKSLKTELAAKKKVLMDKETSYLSAVEAEKVDPDEIYLAELYKIGRSYSYYYPRIKELMYYNLREQQSVNEFRTMISQLQSTNIYSKINKVAKSELTTYTNIPFDINRSIGQKKHLARGGYISARNVQDNFKGNSYTAYGLYENQLQKDLNVGFMVGGSSTKHTLTHNKRTATTTPATSSSKGVSAYLGAYADKKLYEELSWISGLGTQYGRYDVTRNLRNNYQTLTSKGNVNVLGMNTYTGLVLNYPLQEDVVVQAKGILSYSFIDQGSVSEKEGLNLDIRSKKYHYLDSEIGVNLSKTLYDFGVKSNLSAGVYRVFGVYGYRNDDLQANVQGSPSSFGIKGDRIKKDALKLFIDYNVQKDGGLNYGLDGTYITNSNETDVRFGFKAGYTF